MSASEIGFLALGLGVGGAAGAALLAALRSRRAGRPEVRVTITPNAIPSRAARTLAGAPVSLRRTPVPGSPEDDAWRDAIPVAVGLSPVVAAASPDGRTRVPSGPLGVPAGAVGITIHGGPAPRLAGPATRLAGLATPAAVPPGVAPATTTPVGPVPPVASRASSGSGAFATGLAVAVAPPRTAMAAIESRALLDVGGSMMGLAVRPRPPVADPRPRIGSATIAIPIVAAGSRRRTAGSTKPAVRAPAAEVEADACAEVRRSTATRCAAADSTRDAARVAADLLREAQRANAALRARVEEAGVTGDPRRVAAEKERLHAEFTQANDRASGADEAEAAAKAWLTAVSELNARAREAVNRIQAGTAELRTRTAELDRLGHDAEAARMAADHAEAECRAAREALAQCEERDLAARPVTPPELPFAEHWPGEDERAFDRRPTDPVDLGRMPAVIRILRGDAAARESVVAALAGDDPAARPTWQVRIARLTDAITARAIEDGYLDLPPDHPFWGQFNALERRDIVGALSSLGFRYDGLQGFADERTPSARDVSLAVGYAGLDRIRIRAWPGPAELAGLYGDAVVAADLWLAHQDDDLALGRMVDALGARAEGLGEVWDAWGRVRPALLADL